MSDREKRLEGLLASVEGWLPLHEAQFLCKMATQATANIVEIGCYRGRSTVALCVGAAENGHFVHSVDPHRSMIDVYGGEYGPIDRENYYRNVLAAGMAQRSGLVALPSEQAARAWEDPIGLLFVDGDHSYEGVRRDVDVWVPHLIEGGLAVFHDAIDPRIGPSRVIGELIEAGSFRSIETVGKMHALRKL